MTRIAPAVALGALLLAGACGSVEPLRPGNSTPECVHDLTYEGFADGFVRNNCRGCHAEALTGEARHGAPRRVSFDSVEDVRAHREDILAIAVGDNPEMPPAGGPSDAERRLFHEWLVCGMVSETDPEP